MSQIRGKGTKPEFIVRSLLHRWGFRFRVNKADMPGKPDIVLRKYGAVIFVHGCFWHRHRGCPRTTTPSTRRQFWEKKFRDNVERDQRNRRQLRRLGWRVITVWECQIQKDPVKAVLRVARNLSGERKSTATVYPTPTKKEVMKVAERKAAYARKRC